MKNKLIIVILIMAVIALGGLAYYANNTEATKHRIESAKTYARQQSLNLRRKAAVEVEKQHIHDDCVKGQQAYDAQTPAYKKLHPNDRPLCDLQMVQ